MRLAIINIPIPFSARIRQRLFNPGHFKRSSLFKFSSHEETIIPIHGTLAQVTQRYLYYIYIKSNKTTHLLYSLASSISSPRCASQRSLARNITIAKKCTRQGRTTTTTIITPKSAASPTTRTAHGPACTVIGRAYQARSTRSGQRGDTSRGKPWWRGVLGRGGSGQVLQWTQVHCSCTSGVRAVRGVLRSYLGSDPDIVHRRRLRRCLLVSANVILIGHWRHP